MNRELARREFDPARRRFFYQLGAGFGSVALSWLLEQDRLGARETTDPLSPRLPHRRARAKSCIFLIMEGGASHIDTFDPKPILSEVEGELFVRKDLKLASSQTRGKRYFVRSPFAFRRRGHCGMDVSELFEKVGAHADDLAFVRSVHADSDNHPMVLGGFIICIIYSRICFCRRIIHPKSLV